MNTLSSLVNIDSKGYGKIYKAVMRNRQLPLLAKTIYAYFCAYAGASCKAFPKRDKTVRDLKINKDTYTKHLNALVAAGYIAKERTASGNVYTIMQSVPCYDNSESGVGDSMSDVLLMENVKAQGFGTVSKLLMQDAGLSAQAKGIYAYFASFAGAGTTAFPRRSTIARDLKIALSTYYTHFDQLVNLGYVSVAQRKSNGKFDISIYRLADYVEAPTPLRNGKIKAISEKSVHGKNTITISNLENMGEPEQPMSEISVHDIWLKTSAGMSEKSMSEKPISEKSVHGKFGYANIKNRIKTINSLEKEQDKNHQGEMRDNKNPVPLLSLEQAKAIMRYDDLRCEALAWGELKEKLGHFASPKDRTLYMRRISELLNEIAIQSQDMLNASQEPQLSAEVFKSEDFVVFFDNLLAHWAEIRFAKGYVSASLKNILRDQRPG